MQQVLAAIEILLEGSPGQQNHTELISFALWVSWADW